MKVKVLICYPDGEQKIEEQELPEIAPEELQARKAERVADSKTALADYLAAHPLTWTDGSQYSVTAEKQSLLTSQIALNQMVQRRRTVVRPAVELDRWGVYQLDD